MQGDLEGREGRMEELKKQYVMYRLTHSHNCCMIMKSLVCLVDSGQHVWT